MSRWLAFLLAVIIGLATGLVYGWFVNPVRYVDTVPASLRADYRADYVLMVAEAYQGEADLEAAVRRLAVLGDSPALEFVQQAMIYGAQNQYPEADMDLMARLAGALQTWNPAPGGQVP
jgi:uncharacterized membrane protein